MTRSGPRRNGGGRGHPGGSNTVIGVDVGAARALVASYRQAGGLLWDASLTINPLLRQASDLLGTPIRNTALAEVALELGNDADDLEWRIDYLEATDGFDTITTRLRAMVPVDGWEHMEANALSAEQLAVLLARADSTEELTALLNWMLERGSDPGSAFATDDILADDPVIPIEYRALFAGAMSVAYEDGWRGDSGELPAWLTAGMATYGHLSDESLLELGLHAFDNTAELDNSTTPNPFSLDRDRGLFAPFAAHFEANPELGRQFIDTLLLEFVETTDTRLNMHEDHTYRAIQLADIVVATGTWGPLDEREAFVDRLIRIINLDRDTSGPVFWATWAVHSDLFHEHDRATTHPTFDQHHLMPDFIRPTWEHHWHEHISPFALHGAFVVGRHALDTAAVADKVMNPAWTITDWAYDQLTPDVVLPYNDAGGTYTAREKDDFHGLRFHFSDADRGRHVLIHALEDSSDRGDIGQDEFAIINHGTGGDGRPTYTVNLPGVIDLSSPLAGWDPEHMSVRDMDMAALLSATSARVEDNLYAQMVEEALWRSEIPLGSNLLLVGHSFGADTVADLAADEGFTDRYNVTHVVAAAYDSVPQLAHIDPAIDVLVLQNEGDKAILLEATQRRSAASYESVSVNTFAHEIRVFDGGSGTDIGHHQDRYITYLETTNDAELTRFHESLAATGYATSGTSVAIDVTLDQSLVSE